MSQKLRKIKLTTEIIEDIIHKISSAYMMELITKQNERGFNKLDEIQHLYFTPTDIDIAAHMVARDTNNTPIVVEKKEEIVFKLKAHLIIVHREVKKFLLSTFVNMLDVVLKSRSAKIADCLNGQEYDRSMLAFMVKYSGVVRQIPVVPDPFRIKLSGLILSVVPLSDDNMNSLISLYYEFLRLFAVYFTNINVYKRELVNMNAVRAWFGHMYATYGIDIPYDEIE